MNTTSGCNYQTRGVTPGTLPYYLSYYVFPVIFVIGVSGNVLNLLVFGSRGMRTKANCFLSAMATADLCFFFAMLAVNLNYYDILVASDMFLYIYYYGKSSMLLMTNWFSAASIWFAVMVTVERFIAIRFPLKIRSLWTHRRITFIICFITFATMFFQLYHMVWFRTETRPNCANLNKTVFVLQMIRYNESPALYMFVNNSRYISPAVNVALPMILLAVLNGLIVFYIHENRRTVVRLGNLNEKNVSKERKVTIMVLVIVVAFFLCSLPSAIIYIVGLFHNVNQVASVANFLVCVNKALNFVLYCCASKSFRKKCAKLFVRSCDTVFPFCLCLSEVKRAKPDDNGLLMTSIAQTTIANGAETKLMNVIGNEEVCCEKTPLNRNVVVVDDE